jgi:hypothetical protein
MKKLLFVVLIMISGVAVNAQTDKSAEKHSKSTHTTINVSDLKKSITDNIAKNYAGYTIKEAKSVSDSTSLTYHVEVVKGSDKETLIYDKDGKFIKKHAKNSKKKHSSTK